MNEFTALTRLDTDVRREALARCGQWSARFGLALTSRQIELLLAERTAALRSAGRVEFGECALSRLIYAFCDSPYLSQDGYVETLVSLQELFYELRGEVGDSVSDEELAQAMAAMFNEIGCGSLSCLEDADGVRRFLAERRRGYGR